MEMIPPFFALIVTIFTAYLIIKGYKPQPILMFSGIILMASAVIFIPGGDLATTGVLTAGRRTGSRWFDFFAYIRQLFEVRTAALGLLIMSVAGFARYMDHIGASRALVFFATKPLRYLKQPYVALLFCPFIIVALNLVIASASGLGLLLMVTMFPVLVSLGISKLTATALIGSSTFLDLGPASGNANLAAETAGLPVMQYFVSYQIPLALICLVAFAITHFIVQRRFDKKAGHDFSAASQVAAESYESDPNAPPKIYAILPILPLILLIAFSTETNNPFVLHIVTAMLICIAFSMVCEIIRHREAKKVTESVQEFFDGMGVSFARVITLIVAGEVFARGLMISGAIAALINGGQALGLGGQAFTVLMSGIIASAAVVMGSGNAPFFAFAPLVPDVAAAVNVAPVTMILPMQFVVSIARSVSPITAVIVAVSGVAGLSPIDVVKRTAIPMAVTFVVCLTAAAILF